MGRLTSRKMYWEKKTRKITSVVAAKSRVVKMRNCHDKQFYDDKGREKGYLRSVFIYTTCNRETIIQFNHSSSAASFAQSLKHLIFMIACDIVLLYAFGATETDFLLWISINISHRLWFHYWILFLLFFYHSIFFFKPASIISRCSPFKDSRKGQKMN